MNAFELVQVKKVEQAVGLLPKGRRRQDYGRVKLLAGGQDLLSELKERIVEPQTVVDLKQIDGLDAISHRDGEGLSIGALVTLTDLAENTIVRSKFPGLAEAAEAVGTPQIRNLGTVGGNLCQRPRCWYYRAHDIICLKKGGATCYAKDGLNKYNAILGGGPSWIVHPSDLGPMLQALGATVTITGPEGTRELPMADFFITPDISATRENDLAANEVVTLVKVPDSPVAANSTYVKFRERGSNDFAVAAVAAAVERNGATIRQARIVLGGVAPVPWAVPGAEAALAGKRADDVTLQAAADAALQGAEPLAHNGYKVPLTKTLVKRAIRKLMS
jgi:xanthine dehydrogenase YagS FAD-binding subunit